MTTTDPRARMDEIKAEHQPEAWEADAFEYSTSGIGCTGCECSECGNVGDFDGPCPTSDMAAALTAVLDLADRLEWEGQPENHSGDDLDYGRIATAERIRTAITDALGGDRG